MKGIEHLWIIGDAFVGNLSRSFIQGRNDLFIPKYFKTCITAEPSVQGRSNAVGRLLSSIVRCFNNNRTVIPKWIIITPESDIIKSIEYTQFGVSNAYGMLTEYIMQQIELILQAFMGSNLPKKATKYNRPHILWIEPTLHTSYPDNALHIKFIRSMHTTSSTHDKMICLPLKQFWNDSD